MKLGSLCSGFGGLDLAVEAHYGATTVWHAETDKDCAKVLAHHWPGVPNLGDLTLIDWGLVEGVDILTGGYPCQPYSHAGRRKGEDDERAIFAYIADAVGVLRPRVCVFENVAGHLTLGGPGVIATLTELGYDCRWGVVRASDAGAPHRRARWFCVATDASDIGHKRGGPTRRRRPGSTNSGHDATDTDSPSGETRGDTGHPRKRVRVEPVGSTAPLTDPEGAERRGPEHETVGATAGSTTEPGERGRPTATDTDSERLEGHGEPERNRAGRRQPPTPGDSTSCDWSMFTPAITRWEGILGRPAPDPVTDGKLSSRFVSWMMGLPENWVCGLGLSRNAELKMLGNGCMVQQAALGLEILDDQR